MRRLLFLTFILTFTLKARSSDANSAPSASIERVLNAVCLDCHNEDDAEGDLDLSQLPFDLAEPKTRQRWVRIYDRVRKGEMPPRSQSFELTEREPFLSRLEATLHEADEQEVRRKGRTPIRRLTRIEYEYQLRDFLGLPHLDIKDQLPAERTDHGYSRSLATLDLSRVQLESFLDAAETALDTALTYGARSRAPLRYRAVGTDLYPKLTVHAGRESMHFSKQGRMVPVSTKDLKEVERSGKRDATLEMALFRSATWPYYGYPRGLRAMEDGAYRVRFSARAVRQLPGFRLVPAERSVPLTFRARQPSAADVSGDVRSTGGVLDVRPTQSVFETIVHLKASETFEYSLLGLPVPHPITSHGGPLYYNFPPMPPNGHRGIAFQWLEVEGPLAAESWPSPTHRTLFETLVVDATDTDALVPIRLSSTNPRKDAVRVLKSFMEKASVFPLPEGASVPFVALIHSELAKGTSLLDALTTSYQAFLASSHFLYLKPPSSLPNARSHAIAARLSHFLWSSRPDGQLRTLAEQDRLEDPSTLRNETLRMISDHKFERFVAEFTGEWLELKALKRDTPDIRLYPEYRKDDYLIESLQAETHRFVADLIRDNLPIIHLVTGEELWVNDRLAQHYGLAPVSGSKIRRVPRPAWSPYGGLLTQGAILKVTANGSSTSPVLRGAWVMEKLLGNPPPPPPTSVPAVTPDLRGKSTVREQLAAHTEDPVCAGCHARFDPVGFALENFDIMGAWRDQYRSFSHGDLITGIDRAGHRFEYRVGSSVDAQGRLPSGESFQNITQLKSILASQPRVLARNFLQQLIHYTSGVPVRFSDRRVIETILDSCASNSYRAGDLIHGLVQSTIFLGFQPEPDPTR